MTNDDLTCAEFVELVTGYLDNDLDDHTRRRVDEHLATCIGCDDYLQQIHRTVTDLGRLPADHLSDHARDHLLAAFRGWHSEQR